VFYHILFLFSLLLYQTEDLNIFILKSISEICKIFGNCNPFKYYYTYYGNQFQYKQIFSRLTNYLLVKWWLTLDFAGRTMIRSPQLRSGGVRITWYYNWLSNHIRRSCEPDTCDEKKNLRLKQNNKKPNTESDKFARPKKIVYLH
jgi:hypothetical protein